MKPDPPHWKRSLLWFGLLLTIASSCVIEVSFLLLLTDIPVAVLRTLALTGTAGVVAGCALLWLSRRTSA